MQCYANRSSRDSSDYGLRRRLCQLLVRRVVAFTSTAACAALAEAAGVRPPVQVGRTRCLCPSKWSPRGIPILSPTARFPLAGHDASEQPWPDIGIDVTIRQVHIRPQQDRARSFELAPRT